MTRCDRPGPQTGRRLPAVDMSTRSATFELPDPVLTASGCAAAGRELDPFFDLTAIGAVVTKCDHAARRGPAGRPRGWPRRPSGMLNSIGLQGPGIDAFIDQGPRLAAASAGARAVVSIAGGSVEEYHASSPSGCATTDGVTAIEVNISCPNVENRGQVFACDADLGLGGRVGRPPATPTRASRCCAKLSPGRHRHRRDRPGRRRRRRRRALA